MRCTEFEGELQAMFDRGAFDEVDALRDHRRDCAPCREAWDRARLLADAIVAWREQVPEVDLVDAAVAAHLSSRPEPRAAMSSVAREFSSAAARVRSPSANPLPPPKPARWRTWSTAAAAVAALVALAVLLPSEEIDEPSRPDAAIATGTLPAPKTVVADRAGADGVALLDRADATYGSLARSAAGAFEEFAWMMIPPPAMRGPADDGAPPPESWIDGLQHQLRPIGESVGNAFDFLWEVGRAPDGNRT